jgi:hypothetical protein
MRISFLGTSKFLKPVGYNRKNEKRGWHFKKLAFCGDRICFIVSSKYTKKFLVGLYNNG